jgi:hypothetical protein
LPFCGAWEKSAAENAGCVLKKLSPGTTHSVFSRLTPQFSGRALP